MQLILDEKGQGSAEYILLFGALIVVAIVALIIYRTYFTSADINSEEDINIVRNNTLTSGEGNSTPINDTPEIPPSEP